MCAICLEDFTAEGIRVQHRTSCTVQSKYTFLPDRKIKKMTGYDAAALDIAIEGIMCEDDVKSGVSHPPPPSILTAGSADPNPRVLSQSLGVGRLRGAGGGGARFKLSEYLVCMCRMERRTSRMVSCCEKSKKRTSRSSCPVLAMY